MLSKQTFPTSLGILRKLPARFSRIDFQISMLKVPDHQVAGHKALNGKLGPLIDDSGRFYKPLQSGQRGLNEAAFYQSFSSDARIPHHIHKFFPKFYGIQSIEASDGSGLQSHLVLQDLVANYSNPSIMDAKIGSCTWYVQAPEAYIQKCLRKDRLSSSIHLGFRISGLQIYAGQDSGCWKPDKKITMNYTADEVKLVLRKFVSSNQSTELNCDQDCAYASSVYGGPSGILAQLLELKSWFEDQTVYHFYSCSVLMVYDKKSLLKGGGADSGPAIKLVDFAHVVDGDGVIDHNFLGGLSSFITFISEIVAQPKLLRRNDEYLRKNDEN
ncbi:inositol polyphosphate multikinase alpha-like isoform X2 [Silene latifolia]|uniref:inositol polyphosphate multikinase alpha-like isoform X2 n=1 Tax=Silene latifolia TaxID=37657 RepID=UPI003D76FF5C